MPQPRKTTPPLANHTPSPVSSATGSAPQISSTTTQVASSPTSLSVVPSLAQFGRKSSSVSLQSSSVASLGSSPTPSPSPSANSSTVSSRESTPLLQISPETRPLNNEVVSLKPDARKPTDQHSFHNDVMPLGSPAMTNSLISPTEAHFTASSLPSRPQATPTLPPTSHLSREQPVATPTFEGAGGQGSTPEVENSNPLKNEDVEEILRNGSTPVRPKAGGRGQVGGASLNDIHDRINLGVKRTLAERNGGELECGEERVKSEALGNGVGQLSVGVDSALVALATDLDERSRSGTPPNHLPSGESVPEAKRIRVDSPTNSKQQQQQTPQQETQVLSNARTTDAESQVTRQTSFTTSSIRFVNKSPTLVPGGLADSSNQSNRSTTSSSDSVRPVCLWENCMR